MKDKKIPLFLVGLLLIVLSFALGYLVGNGKGETVVTVSSQQPEAVTQMGQPTDAEIITQKQERDDLIDLNTADQAQLETLPGIGPELAKRIVTYREECGPFIAKEQIMDVEGIGEVRYEKMEPLITIGGKAAGKGHQI